MIPCPPGLQSTPTETLATLAIAILSMSLSIAGGCAWLIGLLEADEARERRRKRRELKQRASLPVVTPAILDQLESEAK